MPCLGKFADELASRVRAGKDPVPTWDALRDYADLRTGGVLDCVQLDILTDMVSDRLRQKGAAHD